MRALRKGWRWWLPQLLLLGALAALLVAAALMVSANMARRGMVANIGFLDNPARFPIAESVLPYVPTDSFGWAYLVGLANTLFLGVTIIILSTLLAIPIALARRSDHPLAWALAGGFVDLVRNTPLVVQLLFWYGVVSASMPPPQGALQPLSGIFLADRGLYFTTFGLSGTALPIVTVALGGLALTAGLAWQGRLHLASLATLATVLAVTALWILLDVGIERDTPRLDRYNFVGGFVLTAEFVAVMLGSTLYASGFAAEIIRSGLGAVHHGQAEAARALGLTERQALRLVIVPQALRVMVPPMTSQFIAVLKNTTLALVVGYPELNFIANTVTNHTGQAVQGVAILMLVFLSLSATISLFMHWVNARAR